MNNTPILRADLSLTAQGSARLFGPEALCDPVEAGLIQQYCSATLGRQKHGHRFVTKHEACIQLDHLFNYNLNYLSLGFNHDIYSVHSPLVTVH